MALTELEELELLELEEAEAIAMKKPKNGFSDILTETVSDVKDTQSEIERLYNDRLNNNITSTEALVRQAGQLGKGVQHVYGGVLKAADTALGKVPSALVKGVAGKVGDVPLSVTAKLSGLPLIADKRTTGEFTKDVIGQTVNSYEDLEENFPRTTGLVGGLANIASTIPFLTKPTQNFGKGILAKADTQDFKKYTDLASPPITKKIRQEAQMQGRIKQSAIGKDIIEPTAIEKRAATLMKNIQGLKSSTVPLAEKGNAVQAEAYKVVKDLSQSLKEQGAIIPKREILSHVKNTAAKNIFENPMITTANGSAETASKLLRSFEKVLNESDGTLAGVLKARQDFDKIAKAYKSNVFDATSESAYTIATKEIRNSINELIDLRAPNQSVKERLRDASALFDATENIAEKVALQRDTGLKRAIANLEEAIPAKSEVGDMAMATGAGYAATKAPEMTIVGTILYVGGKALSSSEAKRIIGNILIQGSGAIDQGTKDILRDYINELKQQEDDELKLPARDVINKNKGN